MEVTADPHRIQQFVALLTDHQETLRSYIISQLPGSPDVRDVLQEVNITLWERRDDFEGGVQFSVDLIEARRAGQRG
jgi:RNA polymerase sigma-70 factor (ECF subfamily)